VDPRASLDDVEKRKFLTLPGLDLRSLNRPASCQSLYRLSYRAILHSYATFAQNGKSNKSVERLATGWTTERSEFESRLGQEFSLLYVVQTGSAVHPTSCLMGTGGSSPGVKRQGREADHSPQASAEVKKVCIYTPSWRSA
jgi:hypothetical protein